MNKVSIHKSLFQVATWVALSWMLVDKPTCQAAAPNAIALGSFGESLQAPARVAVDSSGNFYVTDPQAGQVVVFDAFGRKIASHAGLAKPLGIAVDAAENIYLAEEQTGSVSVFDAQWNLLYKLGSGDGEFLLPSHIAFDTVSNTVYVSDSKANTIKVYSGSTLNYQFGSSGTSAGQFDFPAGICVSTNGEVFVVDQNNDRVEVFNRTGSYLRAFTLGSSKPSGRAQAVCIDAAGRLYVADSFQGLVKVFDAATGTSLSSLGSFGFASGQLNLPIGLAIDPLGCLGVSSANNGRIELFGLDSFLHVSVDPSASLVAAGSNLTFHVASGDGTLSYQWLKDGTNLLDATNSILTISNVNLGDTGGYSILATGTNASLTGSVAQVSVVLPPNIASGPQNQTALQGANVQFSVAATGDALRYQWLFYGAIIPDATNSSLVLMDVQNIHGGEYSVIVSNAIRATTSLPATLTVVIPPSIMELLSYTINTDQVFQFTLNADPGYNYSIDTTTNLMQWQSLTNFYNNGGISDYIDSDSTNFTYRFYRIRWSP